MKLVTKASLALLAFLAATITAQSFVYAQNATGTGVVGNLTNTQTIEILIVGTLGGVLLAYQNQQGQKFSAQAFTNDVVHSALVTVPIALSAALTQTNLNLLGLVLVFFASIGVTTSIKNERTPPTTPAPVSQTNTNKP